MRTITIQVLTDNFGGNDRFWQRTRPAMVRAGLLIKVGRQFFGNISDIAAALKDGSFPGASEAR